MSKAYVMMNCNPGEEKTIIESLENIVGIKEAHGTLGLYDIVAQIECTTDKKIQEIVTQQIRKISKIQSSMTLTSSESGQLFEISEVKEADVVFGFYDIVCRIESSTEEVLQDVITRAIRGLPNVKTSMTLNIIKEQET